MHELLALLDGFMRKLQFIWGL